MSRPKLQTIKLLNKSYKIKCPDVEISNLQLSAQKLNEQLLKNKNEFKHLTDYQSLLLAALHISHELINCQSQQIQQRTQLNQFISSLENKINQVTVE
ncbi:cell division protein ZapA [bacterium]|nr:cell division protein ZapA [bacterium]